MRLKQAFFYYAVDITIYKYDTLALSTNSAEKLTANHLTFIQN
jgi:hypothetical protein